MAFHHLVMITGSGPGAGKSTLANRLHSELEARDYSVRLWPETALFEWESLAGLADGFRRRDYPTAGELISVFKYVLGSADSDLMWILDWSWIDLAEDLPWALDDLSALGEFSRRAHAVAAYLQPFVLYLKTDIAVALDRAVQQRGPRWLERRGNFDDVVASYASRDSRIRHGIDAGGWPMAEIQVHSDADHVFVDAVAALRLEGGPGRDI